MSTGSAPGDVIQQLTLQLQSSERAISALTSAVAVGLTGAPAGPLPGDAVRDSAGGSNVDGNRRTWLGTGLDMSGEASDDSSDFSPALRELWKQFTDIAKGRDAHVRSTARNDKENVQPQRPPRQHLDLGYWNTKLQRERKVIGKARQSLSEEKADIRRKQEKLALKRDEWKVRVRSVHPNNEEARKVARATCELLNKQTKRLNARVEQLRRSQQWTNDRSHKLDDLAGYIAAAMKLYTYGGDADMDFSSEYEGLTSIMDNIEFELDSDLTVLEKSATDSDIPAPAPMPVYPRPRTHRSSSRPRAKSASPHRTAKAFRQPTMPAMPAGDAAAGGGFSFGYPQAFLQDTYGGDDSDDAERARKTHARSSTARAGTYWRPYANAAEMERVFFAHTDAAAAAPSPNPNPNPTKAFAPSSSSAASFAFGGAKEMAAMQSAAQAHRRAYQHDVKKQIDKISFQHAESKSACDDHASWLDGLRKQIGLFRHATPASTVSKATFDLSMADRAASASASATVLGGMQAFHDRVNSELAVPEGEDESGQ
jgi:hypothetical protein